MYCTNTPARGIATTAPAQEPGSRKKLRDRNTNQPSYEPCQPRQHVPDEVQVLCLRDNSQGFPVNIIADVSGQGTKVTTLPLSYASAPKRVVKQSVQERGAFLMLFNFTERHIQGLDQVFLGTTVQNSMRKQRLEKYGIKVSTARHSAGC